MHSSHMQGCVSVIGLFTVHHGAILDENPTASILVPCACPMKWSHTEMIRCIHSFLPLNHQLVWGTVWAFVVDQKFGNLGMTVLDRAMERSETDIISDERLCASI
mmetsp:Transcript_24150/g.60465  ORF Transcript_24150/g.60465 Transcript_24150/m.60465 type:complete len:105 (+) Transcript_24150:334-648(+)